MSTLGEDGMPKARYRELRKDVCRKTVAHQKLACTSMEPVGKTTAPTGIMKFVENRDQRKRIRGLLDTVVHRTVESPSLVLMYTDECTCKLAFGLGKPKPVDM